MMTLATSSLGVWILEHARAETSLAALCVELDVPVGVLAKTLCELRAAGYVDVSREDWHVAVRATDSGLAVLAGARAGS
jgi:hypothetical protein